MSERTRIPRIENAGEFGGGWFLEAEHNRTGSEVWFKCPTCRHTGRLTNHSVESNGEVNASVACNGSKKVPPVDAEGYMPRVPCDFHAYVILDGWPASRTKVAGQLSQDTP